MTASERATWRGTSGKTYDYQVFPIGTQFVDKPGNYSFCARDGQQGWSPKYFGEAESLKARLNDREHERFECAKRNGATHIAAHVNSSGRDARLAEETDLRTAYDPTCNRQ